MNNEQLVDKLLASARISDAQVTLWRESAGLLAVLDAIGRDGVNAMVKIDGAREDGSVYTVVITGSKLGDEYFRKDSHDLLALLRDAIDFYINRAWNP